MPTKTRKPLTDEQREQRRQRQRLQHQKERRELQKHTGWQRTLGLTHDLPQSRLCQRPARQPGVAPDCEDARENTPKPISLPKFTFSDKPMP